ncbi:hypothetical protein BKA93DRAFT_747853 [Sparassis latifolia]
MVAVLLGAGAGAEKAGCMSACTPMAPMMQDADDTPTTSSVPGARNHDSAALMRASTAPWCGYMTMPAVHDANNVPTTSPAQGAQARDSLMPARLAVWATDCPTVQVVPTDLSAPTHRSCAMEPAAAAV